MKDWPQHNIPEDTGKEAEGSQLLVRSTPPFKLKQKDGRNIQGINIKRQFGFVPEVLIFERLMTGKNEFVVRALLTEKEAAKVQKLEADNKK